MKPHKLQDYKKILRLHIVENLFIFIFILILKMLKLSLIYEPVLTFLEKQIYLKKKYKQLGYNSRLSIHTDESLNLEYIIL